MVSVTSSGTTTGAVTFTVDPALAVTSTVPANAALGVAVNQSLTATFNVALTCSSVTTSTFTVAGPKGPVAGTITCTGTTATLTPTTILDADVLYTATLTTGITDSYGDSLAANHAWTFTTAPPPTVISTVPAKVAISVPANQVVSATFSEAMNPATISSTTFTLTGPGGTVAGTVKSPSTTSATFSPTADLASNAVYTATITTGAQSTSGVGLASNYVWTFTTAAAPTVTSTIPVNNATGVPINLGVITANFSEAMNAATLNGTTFTVAGPGGLVAGAVTSPSTTSANFSTTTNLAPNTTYTATITTGAQNVNGAGLASNYVWTFKTAPTAAVPPTVISTNPANKATGVPINQIVTATFNEAMDPTTINSATFTLTGPAGVAVAGTVSYAASGAIASFAPAVPLTGLTTYVATITTGAKDLAETPLTSNYGWTFTTSLIADTTKPTIIFTIPANGAKAVPINQAVTATFSKPMNPATINSTTFTLSGPGTTAVPGLVTYASIADTATFTPLANLLPNTVYTATVTTGAIDLSGNPLGPGPVPNPWTFTTAPTVTVEHPTIISTNPTNAIGSVPINATVNATFSEAMDPLTITTATFQLTGPGGAVITGTVAYDAINFIATFTPSSNLAVSTIYVAEITTSVTDLAGNPLEAGLVPNPWTFTTGLAVAPPPPSCGTACAFGGFGGGAGMTNQGLLTVINGDIGTTGASTLMTGFHDTTEPYLQFTTGCIYTETPLDVGTVNGEIYTAPPPPTTLGCPNEGTAATFAIATQAAADALTLFNATSPAQMPCTAFCAQGGELGALTLPPGIYESAPGTFAITNGDLTLDAQGDANAVWVFQMGTSLTVGLAATPRSVILINGAQAKNVFWHVGSAATINAAGGGTMVGSIIASAGITFSTAGNVTITTLNGRALGLNASVTMVNTVINVP